MIKLGFTISGCGGAGWEVLALAAVPDAVDVGLAAGAWGVHVAQFDDAQEEFVWWVGAADGRW